MDNRIIFQLPEVEIAVDKEELFQTYPLFAKRVSILEENGKHFAIVLSMYPMNLKLVLEFICHGQFENPLLDNVISLLNDIRELDIEIQRYTVRYLYNTLTADNIHDFYKKAIDQNNNGMKFSAWRFIHLNWTHVFQSSKIAEWNKDFVDRLVSAPIYMGLEEVVLYRTVYKWAQSMLESGSSDSTARDVMLPFLNKIRFLTMTKMHYDNVVLPSNVLNDEERQAIEAARSTKCVETLPRTVSNSLEFRNSTEGKFIQRWCTLGRSVSRELDKTCILFSKFMVSEDCFLEGVELPVYHEGESVRIGMLSTVTIGESSKTYQMHCLFPGKSSAMFGQPIFVEKYVVIQIICRIEVITDSERMLVVQSHLVPLERAIKRTLSFPYSFVFYIRNILLQM